MTERDHRSLMTVALLSTLLFAGPVAAEPTTETKEAAAAASPSADDPPSSDAKTRTSDLSAPAAEESAKKDEAKSSEAKPEQLPKQRPRRSRKQRLLPHPRLKSLLLRRRQLQSNPQNPTL